jgi:hypothetical protein
MNVEVPDSQVVLSFIVKRKPSSMGAQYAQWQELLVDIWE